MLLTIVLIIFTLILGTMTLMMYLWWKKYGKEMFETFKNLKNMANFGKNTPFPTNFGNKMPNLNDIREQMKAVQSFLNKNIKK